MTERKLSKYIEDWPEESREAAQLVIDQYGEPNEATGSEGERHGQCSSPSPMRV